MPDLNSKRLLLASALLGGSLAPGLALADEAGPPTENGTSVDELKVHGVRALTGDKIPEGAKNAPQSIDVISSDTLEAQGASRLADALRNVPGITFNAGEGSARGDTVNLRGFPAFNDFFLDGVRDAAIYTRDSFDLDAVEVLKGPSAVLFGRGSTGGAINQVSKAPTLAPLFAATLVGGTNDEGRATADIDRALGDHVAVRLNLMEEQSSVAERDEVRNHRWGIAPSIAMGIDTPNTLTLSYLHQTEDGLQDTGIPFVNGKPAPVDRRNFYGLDSDRAMANVDVGTALFRHQFTDNISVSNITRYANYNDLNRVNSAHFGYFNSPGAPTPGTPLNTILVGRDAPSSSGVRKDLINQTDLHANFDTGSISHTLVAGAEFGREQDNTVRYVNALNSAGETPPTSLLNPDPTETAAAAPPKTRAITTAFSRAAYLIDTVHITPQWDLTAGVRYDWFEAHFRQSNLPSSTPTTSLDHTDGVTSPKASLIYRPTEHALFYVSYGTSFDPSAEALSLSVKNANLEPTKANTYEVGSKASWLGGQLNGAVAIFQTEIDNAQTTDPATNILSLAGDQRVRGFEASLNGHITDNWEIIAGYTYLDGITVSSKTVANVGKDLPNVARNAINLWTEYYLSNTWEVGVGANFLDKRFADSAQTATLPSYVLVNAMAIYTVNKHITLQLNVNNIFNKLAYQNAYYASPLENHEVPAAGRTALLTAAIKY